MPTIGEVADFLESRPSLCFIGGASDNVTVDHAASIAEAGPGAVSFCGYTAKDPLEQLEATHATLLIVDHDVKFSHEGLRRARVQAVIICVNARLNFMRVVQRFFTAPPPTGIHPSAIVSESASIGENVYIGPLCTIGPRVRIGKETIIHAGVHIYEGVRIGCNGIIHSGAVIGADGFAYESDADGKVIKFPHIGTVVIEDDVEIGANTAIDRGTLGETRIHKGAKIDNLVHIAHNVEIGENSFVIANAMIGGGTRVGRNSWVGPSASLLDRIHVGANSFVGMGVSVTQSLAEGTKYTLRKFISLFTGE